MVDLVPRFQDRAIARLRPFSGPSSERDKANDMSHVTSFTSPLSCICQPETLLDLYFRSGESPDDEVRQ